MGNGSPNPKRQNRKAAAQAAQKPPPAAPETTKPLIDAATASPGPEQGLPGPLAKTPIPCERAILTVIGIQFVVLLMAAGVLGFINYLGPVQALAEYTRGGIKVMLLGTAALYLILYFCFHYHISKLLRVVVALSILAVALLAIVPENARNSSLASNTSDDVASKLEAVQSSLAAVKENQVTSAQIAALENEIKAAKVAVDSKKNPTIVAFPAWTLDQTPKKGWPDFMLGQPQYLMGQSKIDFAPWLSVESELADLEKLVEGLPPDKRKQAVEEINRIRLGISSWRPNKTGKFSTTQPWWMDNALDSPGFDLDFEPKSKDFELRPKSRPTSQPAAK